MKQTPFTSLNNDQTPESALKDESQKEESNQRRPIFKLPQNNPNANTRNPRFKQSTINKVESLINSNSNNLSDELNKLNRAEQILKTINISDPILKKKHDFLKARINFQKGKALIDISLQEFNKIIKNDDNISTKGKEIESSLQLLDIIINESYNKINENDKNISKPHQIKTNLQENKIVPRKNKRNRKKKIQYTGDVSPLGFKILNLQFMGKKSSFEEGSVSFSTFLEFDQHGGDPHITDSLDYIPIVKDIIEQGFENNVDLIHFIPGKGSMHNGEIKPPVIRPITLATIQRLGLECHIDMKNQGVIIVPLSSYNKVISEDKFHGEPTPSELEYKMFLYRIFKVDCGYFDLEEQILKTDQFYNDKLAIQQAYSAVKAVSDKLGKNVAETIAIWKRNKEEAVKFACDFEDYFESNNTLLLMPSEKRERREKVDLKDQKCMMDQIAQDKSLLKELTEKYNMDQLIIQRIINEWHSNSESIVLMIKKQMIDPYVFFKSHFIHLINENRDISILDLLYIFEKNDYNYDSIQSFISNYDEREDLYLLVDFNDKNIKYMLDLYTSFQCEKDIIKRVYSETKSKKKSKRILRRIYANMIMPYVFYRSNFTDYMMNNNMKVKTLIKLLRDSKYNPKIINQKMLNESMVGALNAANAFNVSTIIKAHRCYESDKPRLIKTIEINLENASQEKAIRNIDRIIDSIQNKGFGSIVLIFAHDDANDPNKKENIPNICTFEKVFPFIEEKAMNEGFKLVVNDDKYKIKKPYIHRYFIINNFGANNKNNNNDIKNKNDNESNNNNNEDNNDNENNSNNDIKSKNKNENNNNNNDNEDNNDNENNNNNNNNDNENANNDNKGNYGNNHENNVGHQNSNTISISKIYRTANKKKNGVIICKPLIRAFKK